jgi:hypothetical protein
MLLFLLFGVGCSQSLYATTFDGNLFSVDTTTFAAMQIGTLSIGSALGMAVRKSDGAALIFSSPLAANETILVESFNVNTQFSGTSGVLQIGSSSTPAGPFYDSANDTFFFISPGQPSLLVEIDPVSFACVARGPIIVAASQQHIGLVDNTWGFIGRTVCGVSGSANPQMSCIDIDTRKIVVQYPVTSSYFPDCTTTKDMIICFFGKGLDSNGCISTNSGIGTFFQLNTAGPGTKVLASISSPKTPVCPLNSAMFAVNSKMFGLTTISPTSPGIWVVNASTQALYPSAPGLVQEAEAFFFVP